MKQIIARYKLVIISVLLTVLACLLIILVSIKHFQTCTFSISEYDAFIGNTPRDPTTSALVDEIKENFSYCGQGLVLPKQAEICDNTITLSTNTDISTNIRTYNLETGAHLYAFHNNHAQQFCLQGSGITFGVQPQKTNCQSTPVSYCSLDESTLLQLLEEGNPNKIYTYIKSP